MDTAVTKSETVPINSDRDIVAIRRQAKIFATEQRFGILDQTKILTAASELSRNTLIHGGGGRAIFELLSEGSRLGLRIIFEDEGCGIADLELAMTDGYTSKHGLGLGLSGSKRLVNEFDLRSAVGEGTTVTVTKWARN